MKTLRKMSDNSEKISKKGKCKIEVDISKKSVKLCGIQINRANAVNRIPLLEGNASQRVIGRWKMTCIF